MARRKNAPDSRCDWTVDEDGVWQTGCEHAFQFNDDGPKENHFKFCPYCGSHLHARELREVR